MSGLVLDAGALIALERGNRLVATLVAEARTAMMRIRVPAGCVAQVWRKPAQQARIAVMLKLSTVDIVPLDEADARTVGINRIGTSVSRREGFRLHWNRGGMAVLGRSLRPVDC